MNFLTLNFEPLNPERLLISNQKYAVCGAQVGHKFDGFTNFAIIPGVDSHLFNDFKTDLSGKLPEILDGNDPDVGGVVPFVRELPGYGSIAGQQQLQADGPIAEIGKADDAFFSDSKQRSD